MLTLNSARLLVDVLVVDEVATGDDADAIRQSALLVPFVLLLNTRRASNSVE